VANAVVIAAEKLAYLSIDSESFDVGKTFIGAA
jgi:hypothetical protein